VRRRLIAASILVAACASAGPPPGGAEDRTPPRLVRVTPDTNAVNVSARSAVFYFDETINDRGTDAQDVSNMFLVSPSDGTPRIGYHRSRIEVRPRHGFRPNTAYTITLLPGLGDLRSNTMKEGATVVFSTGPTIPTARITGIAFDWVGGQPAARALIEAVTPDSVVFLAQADSGGRFSVGPLDPGSYLVRATIDQNGNHRADRGESWDSLRVSAPASAPVELLVASRDTLPARLATVTVADSVTLRLTFDRLLDPAQQFPLTAFRIAGSDSVAIAVTSVRTPAQEAELALTRQRQMADSVRRADSLARRPLAPVQPPSATAQDSLPKPSRPAPFTALSVVLARPLALNTPYRARVTTVRALSGRTTESERLFTTPRAEAPRAAADSAAPRGVPPRGVAPPRRQ
jgi:hypothetical protein